MLDIKSPLHNTVLFYIIIVITLLFIKPRSMYCYETNKFKQFGCNENQTLIPFSIVSISSGIILYMVFSIMESICC